MADDKAIAGYAILGVGFFLALIAIILILVVIHKRRKAKYRYRDPAEFKVVYKMPETNGTAARVVGSDVFDGRSVHTIARSEPGYAYVAPPRSATLVSASASRPTPTPVLAEPMMVRSPPVVAVNPLPRAVSLDHLNVPSYATIPRAGYRHVYPAGAMSRVLVPVSRKKAKRMQKRVSKPVYMPVYSSNANASASRSVLSAPAYATSTRSLASGTGQRNKYYMYGSTPNLHANQYTQPVLMYDGKKRYFHADEITAGRNEHVHNWLQREHRTSMPADADVIRSRAESVASAPTEYDRRSETSQGLYMRWSPSMRRRLDEKDRREAGGSMTLGHELPPSSPRRYQPLNDAASVSLGYDVPPSSPKRYQPLHHYTEVTETF